MADDKRKKKRGRKTKLNLRSCFPSFAPLDERHSSSYCKSNDRDLNNGQRLRKLITVSGCNTNEFITDVEIVNGDRDRCSSHRRRISRLFKAVLSELFMVKKKINRSSSKSSTTSDTIESSSSLSSEKTIKSINLNNAIRIRESTDLDSSLLSSCSRTTSSSNVSSSCCSSSNSSSQWSSEQKTTSSRVDLVDLKLNPVPINFTSRSDSLPKPNENIYPRTLDSSNSLRLPKPNHNHNKIKSSGNNRNNIRWCLFLLLSLVVLVVYGRIYSILCTSTWFYFVPCRSRKMKRANSVSNNPIKVVDTDSEQYKKRVIMAGLLDRTRDPLR